ncbi:MAG TPA: superoxide dismutase family protein [Salinisphaeraceae bacterium]|nr:superoxide dismutase family protein [Salinisphaeraceae bacterium]
MCAAAFLVALGLLAQTAHADDELLVSMQNADGESVGSVKVNELEHGTLFVIDLKNLPPNGHGFHIHENGTCEPPHFKSAGDHYNPANKKHGYDNEKGYHAGDLANIVVSEQGTAQAEIFASWLVLEQDDDAAQSQGDASPHALFDGSDARAIIIHENADSYEADSGTGGRIACGVIERNEDANES